MPEKPRRPQTHADRDAEGLAARRERDALHALPFAVDDDLTGQHERGEIDGEELRRRRERRPTPERLIRLEEQRDADTADVRELKATIGQRFDRVDRSFERLHESLTAQSDRVIRNDELVRTTVWPATQQQMARNDEISRRVSATERVADGVETLIGALKEHAARLSAIEAEQKAAAERFKAHDARDQSDFAELKKGVGDVELRVGGLEQGKAVADATAKQRKQISKIRPWWWSSKGVVAVLVAVGGLITTVYGLVNAGG